LAGSSVDSTHTSHFSIDLRQINLIDENSINPEHSTPSDSAQMAKLDRQVLCYSQSARIPLLSLWRPVFVGKVEAYLLESGHEFAILILECYMRLFSVEPQAYEKAS